MTIEELKLHWQYFLTIDEEFAATDKYVDHTVLNLDTYSIEFSKLLILICNEFETMCKLIYKHYVHGFNMNTKISILDLSKKLTKKCPYIRHIEIISALGEKIMPLSEWCTQYEDGKYKLKLSWWTDYNSIKHNRHQNFKNANLKNVINAISSLYVLFIYMAFLLRQGSDYIFPVLPLDKAKSISCYYSPQVLTVAPPEIPYGFE